MVHLASVLGDPQRTYPVVHVTGTNGKGSTARMITALLVESGLTVGTYTSPHLDRLNERVARNLEPIDDEAFAELLTDVALVEPLLDERPNHFELVTAAALRWFADVAVDVAVLEVGLLGRYDATNVADASVAVVTNVAGDHTDFAPGWRQAVASEKAGIVKPGSVLVLGEDDPDLRPIFLAEHPRMTMVRNEDFGLDRNEVAVGGRLLDVRTPAGTLEDVFLPVHGGHQGDNAAAAITAVEAFFARGLDQRVVAEAFAGLTLPGRFEVVGRKPLVVIDGAHNADGASAAIDTLAEEFDIRGRLVLVTGVLSPRDPMTVLAGFGVDEDALVVACEPPSPRAVDASLVALAAEELGAVSVAVTNVEAAIDRALSAATEDDVVLISGSLALVGPARRHLRR